MSLFVRVHHPINKELALVIKIKANDSSCYEILSAKVLQMKNTKTMARNIEHQDFSKEIERFGFDETEVRLELENAIESTGQGEDIL